MQQQKLNKIVQGPDPEYSQKPWSLQYFNTTHV